MREVSPVVSDTDTLSATKDNIQPVTFARTHDPNLPIGKVAILRKLGLKDLYPYEDFVKLISDPGIRQLTGPANMQHRFITEDCPMGMVALTSFGDLVGVPTPVCKSVISLFSAIVGRDFFKDGRNLKRLGLAGMSLDQLKKFLIEGSC